MKWHSAILFSLILSCSLKSNAQQKFSDQLNVANQYITQQFPQANYLNSSFTCKAIKQSPFATYLTFQQLYNEVPIENAILKITVNNGQEIISLKGNHYETADWNLGLPKSVMLPAQFMLPNGRATDQTYSLQPRIKIQGEEIIYVYTYNYEDSSRAHYTITTDENGELITIDDHKVYFSEADTTVITKVFLPDPLTSANVDYGFPYVDDNDNDIIELNNQAAFVTMKVQLEDGIFYIRNENIVLKDLNAPTTPVVTSELPEFLYTRSESGFEDVNTFFHLTNLNKDIIAAGYEDLQDFYIEVDPHGASGADQSFYISATVPSIQFGEGGVDDAEDADVIIHEYSHALSDHASPLSNSGLERRAIDEGYGDYFAASYSRKFSDFNWEDIFSWDGHNEFWFGRNANSNKHYPENNSDNIYASCEIWSGALMDIFDIIGKENTDLLVYESLYGSFPNMTMPDAAQIILAAEELIFDGAFYTPVFDALFARGLIYPNAIQNNNNHHVQILNTGGFATNNEPIFIQLETTESVTVHCYNMEGKLVDTFSGTGDFFEWNPQVDSKGLFIIEIIGANYTYAQTLIVY